MITLAWIAMVQTRPDEQKVWMEKGVKFMENCPAVTI
jgi:hypothetical protein